jgi:hypothetical protein
LFSYARYNVVLHPDALRSMGITGIDAKAVAKLDAVKHADVLREVGRELAKEIDMAHSEGFLT